MLSTFCCIIESPQFSLTYTLPWYPMIHLHLKPISILMVLIYFTTQSSTLWYNHACSWYPNYHHYLCGTLLQCTRFLWLKGLLSLCWMQGSIYKMLYQCHMVINNPICTCCATHHPFPYMFLLVWYCYCPLWICLSALLPLGISYHCLSLLSIFVIRIVIPLSFKSVACPLHDVLG